MDSCLAPGEYLGATVAKRSFGGLFLTESSFPPNTILDSHVHEAATICLVLQGCFEEQSDRNKTRAEAGLVLYRPEGHRHSDRFLNARGRTLGLDLVGAGLHLPQQPITLGTPRIGLLGAQIYREFRRNDECSALAVEELVLLLHDEMTRSLSRVSLQQPKWLRLVKERLAEEYVLHLSLAELAREAGVHPVHLSREFQRFFGCSLGQYVRKLRVEHGRRHLSLPDLSIGEVAQDAGFCDQAHFTRAFKEFIGMTPGEYRSSV